MLWFVFLLLGILMVISLWIVFDKLGQPGWAVLIPVYGNWVFAQAGGLPGWLGLAMCACGWIEFACVGPLVWYALFAVISVGIGKESGRGVAFGIGLALLPVVFYPILAFSRW